MEVWWKIGFSFLNGWFVGSMFNLPGCTTSTQNTNPNYPKLVAPVCFETLRVAHGSSSKFSGLQETAAPPRLEHQRSPWWIDGWLRYHPRFLDTSTNPILVGFFEIKAQMKGFFHPSILSCPPGKKTRTKSSFTKKWVEAAPKKIDSGLYISEKWTWFTRKSPLWNFGEGTSYLVHHCVVFSLNWLIAQWSHRHINNRIFAVICLKTHGWKTPFFLHPYVQRYIEYIFSCITYSPL